VSLGTTILSLLDPNSGTLQAGTLTGSGTLFCQVGTAGQCATDATSDSSSNAGHASGLGVTNGRLNENETLTIAINPGFVATLVSFQVTAMVAGVDIESAFYNLNGGGNTTFQGGNNAIDTILVNSGAFTSLVFGTPTGGPNGGNTWTLHSLTLDITSTATPEPGTLALMGSGLLALGVFAKRRRA
jgi:hypothetical protein